VHPGRRCPQPPSPDRATTCAECLAGATAVSGKIRGIHALPEPNESPFSDLSVIVVAHNSSAVLPDCLRSLEAHAPTAEVIVVDNGSPDEPVALAGEHPGVLVVTGHGNVGFGGGVNRGAEAATRRLLLVLNPDVTVIAVDPPAMDLLRRDDVTGVIGCRVQDKTLKGRHLKYDAWGWRAELYWTLGQFFLVPREVAVGRPRLGAHRRRQWIAGAAFIVAREEFLAAGGFDDQFFLYFEDFDLCRTYSERGLPIRTTDAFAVSHIGQRSSPRDESTMAAYCLLSLIQYVHKWEGPDAARDAASRCLRVLRGVEVAGTVCARVPLLGPRAAKKQRSAEAVRLKIAAEPEHPSVAGAYGAAADAVRSALAGRAL